MLTLTALLSESIGKVGGSMGSNFSTEASFNSYLIISRLS
jgi:hypothetical protein